MTLVISELKGIELFAQFKDDELARFAPVIEKVELPSGRNLFVEGDPGDSLCIIVSGAIRVYKTIDSMAGEEKSLALLSAGAYLGEMTLLEGSPRSASARAEFDSVIFKITRENFIRLLREYPQAAIRFFVSFMNVLSERLRRTNEELVVLYEIGKVVGAAPPIDQLLEGVLRPLVNTVKVEMGAVFVLNEITGKLECKHAVGQGSSDMLNIKIREGEGVVGKALAEQETLCVRNFDNAPECAGLPRLGFERPDMLIAPLARAGRPFGALLLAQRLDGKGFDNANINLINGVASQAAAAIEAALFQQDTAARENFDRKSIMF